MLKLVIGPAHSGKTEYLIELAAKRASAAKRSLLLVPDQVSFEYEKLLCSRMCGKQLAQVSVKSVSALCRDIFKRFGGAAKIHLGDAEKAALARRAVALCGSGIEYYRGSSRNPAFYAMAADTVDELRRSGVTPAQLAHLAETSGSPTRRAKLAETALIYESYAALAEQKYTDSETQITDAVRLCERGFFAATAVMIDEFDGFSAAERQLVELMMTDSELLCCALCTDSLSAPSPALTTAAATGRRLLSAAAALGTPGETVTLSQTYFAAAGLANTELLLREKPAGAQSDGVYFAACSDRYDEVRCAAAEIALLVRERGFSYSDIHILVNNIGPYRAPLRQVFAECGIPLFFDFGRDLSHTALITLLCGILQSAERAPGAELLLRILKTGLCDADTELVSALENYIYIWDIDAAALQNPFFRNPRGIAESFSAADRELLDSLERLRRETLAALGEFAAVAEDGEGDAVVRALYACAVRLGAVRRAQTLLGSANKSAEDVARQFELTFALLDNLHALLYGERVSCAQLEQLLRISAAASAMYDIPQTLRQVSAGTAGRTRSGGKRVVFVLGLCDGEFPAAGFAEGMLTHADRDFIAASGIELQTTFERRWLMEQTYFYRALCSASQRLYLLYPKRAGGESCELSAAAAAVVAALSPPPPECDAQPLGRCVSIDSVADAYALCCRSNEAGSAELAAVLSAAGRPELEREIADSALPPDFTAHDRELSEQYLGERLRLSPSAVDCYEKCSLMYLLRYVLNIKALKKADMTAAESGNFVHFVLQHTLEDCGGDLREVSAKRIEELCAAAATQYIRDYMGGNAERSSRVEYITGRLREQSARLLRAIKREQRQSEFLPADYELRIAADGDVPPRELELPGGKRVAIEGKVDRVDVMGEGDSRYVRVVDYKTGSKKFSLSDIYYGLNVQMLVYLFSLCGEKGGRYGTAIPAGVLYLPADPLPTEEPKNAYCMDGLVLNDRRVVEAMERDAAGVFIPVKCNKSGELGAADKLASLARLGNIRAHIDELVGEMARALYDGEYAALPLRDMQNKLPCEYCDYSDVCRREDGSCRAMQKLDDKTLFEDER